MSDQRIKRIIGLVYNPRIQEASLLARKLIKSLDIAESSWLAPGLEIDRFQEHMAVTSLVITLGGDGTILRTAKVAAPLSVPILGINLGRVGFMTEIKASEALDRVPHYINGDAWLEERLMLMATVLRTEGTSHPKEEAPPMHALNDVVLSRSTPSGMIDIETHIDSALLTTYRADGLIVATPTGSTGYALSAGGAILYPQALDILIQPVASHLSMNVCLVLPAQALVELTVRSPLPAVLSVDGFMDTPLSPGDRVRIQQSPYTVKFLRGHPKNQFFATLTKRLGLTPTNWTCNNTSK